MPREDEDLCYLSGDWRLFQKRRGHRWSLDDLVTAHVATQLPANLALDLGCGLGSVLLMLAWKKPQLEIWGIEAQAERAAMARRSINYNGADDRCFVVENDLRAAKLDKTFELITGTPPYFPRGTGTETDEEHISACRFEFRGGVEAYLDAARRHLACDGAFVMVAPSAEDTRVLNAREALWAHQQLRVVPREGKPSLLSVWTFRKTPMRVTHVETLTVRGRDGQWTEQFRKARETLGLPSRPPRVVERVR